MVVTVTELGADISSLISGISMCQNPMRYSSLKLAVKLLAQVVLTDGLYSSFPFLPPSFQILQAMQALSGK
jgi:hypothetical protein